ncbi:MAG: serine hydrolase, partial [Gammaproteobacteria bacterium]|nr:serine hydrolase [Gammaproteobacteria bacterium]
GLIDPSDPVEKYIPEFKGIKVAVLDEKADKKTSGKAGGRKGRDNAPEYRLVDAHRPVTIHDLLTHTSGLSGRALGRTREIQHEGDTLATWIPVLAEGPLSFQPGTRWGYGGGLDVVARVVEIVSGMPFNEFVQKRIFEPLDMKDTHWIVPEDKLHRMLVFVEGKAGTPTTYFSGSAGLVSTARDYLHFEQMLVNQGELFGNRLLEPESVEMMATDHVGDRYAAGAKGSVGVGFGYTVAITVDPKLAKTGRSAGAFGWGGAAGTVSWTDPKEELAVAIMVQQPTNDLGVRIAEAVAAAIDD